LKAARFYGGKDIRVETVPDPVPGPGQVLVRVKAAGICGSDLHGYRANQPGSQAPRTSGHELAGVVEALGSGVTKLSVGQRVGVEPLIGCGVCDYCQAGQYHLCDKLEHIGGARSGGFAELTVAPEDKAFPLPDHVDMDDASILDVLAVAVHALTVVPVEPGDRVAVVGTGAIGLATAAMAAIAGAGDVAVLGRRPGPLSVADELCGATGINVTEVDPVEAVMEWSGGRGANVVYEAVGGMANTLNSSLLMTAPQGTVGLIGVFREPTPIDTRAVLRREVTLAWVWSYARRHERAEFEIALDLLSSGKLKAAPMITHRLPLDEIAHGFDIADRKSVYNSIKVVIHP